MAALSKPTLRERKKARTRKTIVLVALELFSEQGYHQTTIAQIAESAEVSPRTVSTYFPAKEDIVFDLDRGAKERLEIAIRDRSDTRDTMSTLREWLIEERLRVDHDHQLYFAQRKAIERENSLLAREQVLLHEFQLVLVEGLAVDLGLTAADLQPRMAAAAAMAVFDLLHTEGKGKRAEGELPSVEEQLEVLDQALDFINGGVSALRERGS